jgi:UDP-N-acetyl-D-glucosamine dehydrogenase
MRPGLGVGGYCLTKDPLLASWSATQLFGSRPLEQSEAAVHINDSMPLHTFDVVKRLFEGNLSGKSALLLGVSYLNDVADTRFTPVALLYDELRCEGVTVTLHDPLVKYWEERGVAVQNEIDDVLSDKYDLVIICTAHSEYRQSDKLRDYLARCRGTRVVDAWGLLDQETVEEVANHNVIRIIGRGDI